MMSIALNRNGDALSLSLEAILGRIVQCAESREVRQTLKEARVRSCVFDVCSPFAEGSTRSAPASKSCLDKLMWGACELLARPGERTATLHY